MTRGCSRSHRKAPSSSTSARCPHSPNTPKYSRNYSDEKIGGHLHRHSAFGEGSGEPWKFIQADGPQPRRRDQHRIAENRTQGLKEPAIHQGTGKHHVINRHRQKRLHQLQRIFSLLHGQLQTLHRITHQKPIQKDRQRRQRLRRALIAGLALGE